MRYVLTFFQEKKRYRNLGFLHKTYIKKTFKTEEYKYSANRWDRAIRNHIAHAKEGCY